MARDTVEQKYGVRDLDLLAPLGTKANSGQRGSLDLFDSVDVLKGAMRGVSRRVIGTERLASQTLLALLNRSHQIIYGRPGTAKSLYAREVFGQFDTNPFFIQFTQGVTEEALVGAYDLEKFQEGTIWHNTEGTIIPANFAFLDEFFDANDMVLRTLLGILNERAFAKGTQYEKSNLHTAIAATNFIRRTDNTEAILDRFLFKANLSHKTSRLDQLLIDEAHARSGGNATPPVKPLDMAILTELSKVVKGENPDRKIEVSQATLFVKDLIVDNYIALQGLELEDSSDKELYVSPRSRAIAGDVLKATALLQGRFEVNRGDLVALRYLLTTIGGNTSSNREVDDDGKFFDALNSTLASFGSTEFSQVESLMEIYRVYDAWSQGTGFEARRADIIVEPELLRLRQKYGFGGWSQVNSKELLRIIAGLQIRHENVGILRDTIADRITRNG